MCDEKVGKAFLCTDGLIRWITGLSTRGYYHCFWREADCEVWHVGGLYKEEQLVKMIVEEVPSPQPHQPYKKLSALGGVVDCIASTTAP